MYLSDRWVGYMDAKCDKSPLNYCHMLQLEPAITQLSHPQAIEVQSMAQASSGGSRGDPGVRANPPLDPC